MAKKVDAKLIMLDHSKAKVELYSTYLSVYLNILSRVSFVNKIHLFDLMCGEGIYADNSKGSPVQGMETIKNHYYSNNKSCPNMEIWFNDKDKSEIEKDKNKIERVQEACAKVYKPNNVNIKYTNSDYLTIQPQIKIELEKLKKLKGNEKALLFVDPYGYKEVKPSHMRDFLECGHSEVILFLPISHMYRFANKSLTEDFPGGEPLEKFLLELFGDNKPEYSCVKTFINVIKSSFRERLKDLKIYVDTFTIERDSSNTYCLFFFTSHVKGFEVMLDTKWKLDEQEGNGFRIEKSGNLFDTSITFDYPDKLEDYIKQNKKVTNANLFLFGLENGFLPKHTGTVLKMWQAEKPSFKVTLENGGTARKGSFKINSKTLVGKEHLMNFSFK
jgi:three-Cys-motif partner protein